MPDTIQTITVRNSASGREADLDYYPHNTVQDFHDMLIQENFLNRPKATGVVGAYEFTLMPDNRLLRPAEKIADLPLTTGSFLEVTWAMSAGSPSTAIKGV